MLNFISTLKHNILYIGYKNIQDVAIFPTHVGVFPSYKENQYKRQYLPHARGGVSDAVRLPCALISATIAKSKAQSNGDIGLGRAISKCYQDGPNSDQAKAKLRRLLACDDVDELCRILRPMFSLIDSRVVDTLNYDGILKDLLYFRADPQKVKSKWAQDFYNCKN